MPTAEQILNGLTIIARDWPRLAIAWHVYFGVMLAALAAGWRPQRRDLGLYLVLPLISVSMLAWFNGNPFTGTAIAAAGFALLVIAAFLGRERVAFGPWWLIVPGAALVAFGWVYPEHIHAEGYLDYLYRAPTGLLPCPTLAVLCGISLMLGGLESRAWRYVLALAGAFYGLVGALYLGVTMDWALVAGAVLLAAVSRAESGDYRVATPRNMSQGQRESA